MSLLLPAAVFFLGTTVGTVCGFGLAALLTAGKLADIETERAEWERIARRASIRSVMAEIGQRPAPGMGAPHDYGALKAVGAEVPDDA